MKIKSIAAICKKNKNIAIFERYSDDGDILTQYIGDGSAVYPVIGLPPLDAESLLTIKEARWRTMPKMTVRVILKSGVEFSIKCDKFTLTRNGFQQVTGYNIEGITENQPVYLDFEQVAAVVRVFSDEKEVAHDEQGASIL